MITPFQDPASWVLLGIIAIGLVHAVAAVVARPRYALVRATAEAILQDPHLTAPDRMWVRMAVEDALDRKFVWATAAASPFFAAAAIYALAADMRSAKGKIVDHAEKEAERSLKLVREAERVLIKEETGVDPASGRLWKDPRRTVLTDASLAAQFLSAPLASMLILANLLVALPLVGIFWLLSMPPVVLAKALSPRAVEVFGPVARFLARDRTSFSAR